MSLWFRRATPLAVNDPLSEGEQQLAMHEARDGQHDSRDEQSMTL